MDLPERCCNQGTMKPIETELSNLHGRRDRQITDPTRPLWLRNDVLPNRSWGLSLNPIFLASGSVEEEGSAATEFPETPAAECPHSRRLINGHPQLNGHPQRSQVLPRLGFPLRRPRYSRGDAGGNHNSHPLSRSRNPRSRPCERRRDQKR